MSGSYGVVLADLQAAADTFHTESTAFAAIVPTDGPPCVDGGDAAVDDMMKCVTEAIGALHLSIAGIIGAHGDKLQLAHDSYQKCEVSMRELYDDLSTPGSITKLK